MSYNIKKYLGSVNVQKKAKKSLCIFLAIVMLLLPIWYFNNFSIKINEQTINSSKVISDIHIAVLSDIHGVEFGTDNEVLINKIKTISPDLIFVLGDMYSRGKTEKIDQTIELLKVLTDIADVYIITGDHDTDESYKSSLIELKGVHFLNYDKEDVTVNGNRLCIYGINNVYFTDTFDLNHAFEEPDSSKLNILLAHIPSIDSYKSFDVDIIFSGDTHGGMIRLPFLGGLYYKGYILPKITYSGTITDKGMYRFDNKTLFVTSGMGDYPLPLRLNNRPEICSITISKGE
jgi:predicted MPP superfamily phosphohydrolase